MKRLLITLGLFLAMGCAGAPPAAVPATTPLSVSPAPTIAVSTMTPAVSPLAPPSPHPTVPPSPSPAPGTVSPSPAPTPTGPAPASALIGAFTWQVDEPCGYRFLRPAAWAGAGLTCLVRAYPRPNSDNRADRVVLEAYNYRVLDQQSGTAMMEAAYQPFRRHPTLVDWMGALETNWRQTGVSFTLAASLPQARVYQMDVSPGDVLMLSAFKVDQGQPLGLVLIGYGGYGDLARLRSQRLWDDYLTMVNSLGATREAPGTATVTGRIVLGYGDHSPVADLPLWVGTESVGQPATRTDAGGRFTLTNLPVGQVVDVVDDHLAFQINITSTGTLDAGTFEYPLVHPGADLTPTPAAAAGATPAPDEVHTTLPSGLTIDEYALQGPPTLDPLDFTLVRGTLADILARHAKDGGAIVPRHEAFDAQGEYMSTEWNGQTLIARQIYTTTPTGGVVDVFLGSQKIYRLPIGDVSPLTPLRQLFTYDGHWLLEAALVTHSADTLTNTNTLTATGQIVEDGVLLNARDGYQAAFGLQPLRGRLFYFFQQAGQIGMAYDGHNALLGYDAIPHYGCCSGAELNPQQRENMVAFFAQRASVWYYVEIGAYPK